jgi:hypothetical protein
MILTGDISMERRRAIQRTAEVAGHLLPEPP